MNGALLVAGTTTDAGKSVITAALCRWLRRQGVRVAPFKAQNMSLNSFVTLSGDEIGRAQAMQAAEPGVLVRFAAVPAELADADLVVLPGSRATVADLAWLRESGFAEVIAARASKGLPVLGICGGYQMLARQIDDLVESGQGTVPGLGILPCGSPSAPTRRWPGRPEPPTARRSPAMRCIEDDGAERFLDGCRACRT